jgi:hypothetical protein
VRGVISLPAPITKGVLRSMDLMSVRNPTGSVLKRRGYFRMSNLILSHPATLFNFNQETVRRTDEPAGLTSPTPRRPICSGDAEASQ